MNFGAFIKECYLKSTPSVDLDKVTKENPVDCCKHTLKISDYEDILKEYCKTNDEKFACNMWLLQSGPQLKED